MVKKIYGIERFAWSFIEENGLSATPVAKNTSQAIERCEQNSICQTLVIFFLNVLIEVQDSKIQFFLFRYAFVIWLHLSWPLNSSLSSSPVEPLSKLELRN